MREYKVKTKVKRNFNDRLDNNKPYEKEEPITLDRARYEELLSKGIVYVGEEIKKPAKKFDFEKEEENEDNNRL